MRRQVFSVAYMVQKSGAVQEKRWVTRYALTHPTGYFPAKATGSQRGPGSLPVASKPLTSNTATG